MELFLSDNDGQVGSPFFHRNNTSISFHLKFPNKRLRAFFKKHTTFLKRGRMVVFELLKRTFHKWKWKWNIFDTFGISIDCEKVAPYRYYITNVDDMKSDSIQNWLLNTLSVSNSLLENKSIKDRIILELP